MNSTKQQKKADGVERHALLSHCRRKKECEGIQMVTLKELSVIKEELRKWESFVTYPAITQKEEDTMKNNQRLFFVEKGTEVL